MLRKKDKKHAIPESRDDHRDFYQTRFAMNLRTMRQEAGISQYQLADVLGIAHPSIRDYEEGKVLPNLFTALRIADFFHISLDALFNRESAKHGFPKQFSKLEREMWERYFIARQHRSSELKKVVSRAPWPYNLLEELGRASENPFPEGVLVTEAQEKILLSLVEKIPEREGSCLLSWLRDGQSFREIVYITLCRDKTLFVRLVGVDDDDLHYTMQR